ncbi:MFS transporter [Alicyclobacillus cycloheptanicus]|uniref:DHA1 family multidrug resistance protein-like MFS transporter n=1 Tax=Alicyclobacillus cycloheptanicus TaxID=1457 RepID=A0ABT9XFB6_9BACL|nr:MFS transporter [Alicyclobacillus cycloheptanicus]MDQ0188523.1 DHA1 family multidrug resistance protein-like MFS transporter [Alicyclobacillus cycloheptanicus]WDM01209.1 MFS transporter [Alicyclobacillus cycloheptanicus]
MILWPMVIVQFFMSSALTIMAPFLPLYLVQIGVHPMSHVDMWSGILSSVNFLMAALLSPVWGSLADRSGRKAMVLRSSAAICVFTALMGFSHNVWELLVLRLLMGMFSGFSASAIALVATQMEENKLGFALGWLSTGQLVGGLVGPLLGGVLADIIGDYRFVFFWTSAISFLAVLITLFIVKERKVSKPQADRQKQPIWKQLMTLRDIQGLFSMFVVLLLAQFATRSLQPVVTVYVKDIAGNVPYLATLAGFAFSVTGMGDLVASPFLGKRSDRIGYKRVLLISLLADAVFTIPQAFTRSVWVFIALRFCMGMFMGGILPTANALVGRLTSVENRGKVYGLTSSATFLGSFLGPMVGGMVSAAFGIPVMFYVTAALLLMNWIWIAKVVQEPPHEEMHDVRSHS